jgi:membrane protein involved in colicin uptake
MTTGLCQSSKDSTSKATEDDKIKVEEAPLKDSAAAAVAKKAAEEKKQAAANRKKAEEAKKLADADTKNLAAVEKEAASSASGNVVSRFAIASERIISAVLVSVFAILLV